MRQVAQQLTLKRHGALQALRHMVETSCQLTQFVLAPGDRRAKPGRQITCTQRGRLASKDRQGGDQQPIKQQCHDHSQHGRQHALQQQLPQFVVLARVQTLRQLHDQPGIAVAERNVKVGVPPGRPTGNSSLRTKSRRCARSAVKVCEDSESLC